jgi:hypothetical protein
MKIYIIEISIAVLSITLSCNKDLNKERFIHYSSLIKDAERYILDSSYVKAKKKYEKAFHIVDKPLASHCYTAIQVSAQIKDVNSFKVFLKKGLERGLTVDAIKSDSLINTFIKQNNLSEFLIKEYRKGNILYEKSINKFLKDTIQKLSEIDNKWKVFYLDSLSNIDVKNKTFYWAKYDSIVSILVENKLMPLVQEYGYPGERSIGHEKVGNSPYNFAFVNNRAKLILLHYYSFPRNCDYNQILKDEVKKGNLLPEQFASIIDFQAKWGQKKFCTVEFYNQWWTTDDPNAMITIDKNRMNLGLEIEKELRLKQIRGQQICNKIRDGYYKHIKLFYWCG